MEMRPDVPVVQVAAVLDRFVMEEVIVGVALLQAIEKEPLDGRVDGRAGSWFGLSSPFEKYKRMNQSSMEAKMGQP